MRLFLVIAIVSALIAVPAALATTQPSLIVGVNVALTPNAVTLSAKQVRRGYYVEFKVRNATSSRRLFSVAGRTIAIPPRKFRYLVVNFLARGTYPYVSRRSNGTAIRGTFRVS
jgi:hypothetical protein